MAHENKVLKSINSPDGGRCVDIFVRPDDTFGFEEFRRDSEDARGWFPIGGHGGFVFDTEEATFNEALAKVPWLGEVVQAG
jgi:hypothetical protein